jgi:hypothetical protein
MFRTTLILSLSCTLFATGAEAQTPQQGRRLQDIVLDSGVTLADWVRVTRTREPTPSLATGAQAAQFVRQHGAHRELLDIVWRAAQHSDLERESITRENATERLVALTDARRQLGDWPSLLMASAAARAYLGDAAGATADLRRWMMLAPVSDPSRGKATEVLLSVAQKPDAVVTWLMQSGIGSIPIPLRRPVDPFFRQFAKEMARARECLGPPAQYDDLIVLQESKWAKDGTPFSFQLTLRTTEIGLPSSELKRDPEQEKYILTSQAIVSPAGSWSRLTQRAGEIDSDFVIQSRRIECSEPLLPASKGKKVDISLERETTSHRRGPQGSETDVYVYRDRQTIEYLSDAIALEELATINPALRLRLPSDYRGRFYLARWRTSTEDISPPRAGASRSPTSSFEAEGLFVEGPNAFVGLKTSADGLLTGSTWTLTRP